MEDIMDVISIILSLVLLMTFAYRGFSVIVVAPIFALCAAVLSGLPIMPSYTELFMGKAVCKSRYLPGKSKL
jgi:H+/gluconate symporter-like permease